MKTFRILIFVLTISGINFKASSQLQYFKVENDSITIYLDEVGDITLESKAKFYRKAKLDKFSFNYVGKVCDYFMNNQKAYECNITNGQFHGNVTSYYENGVLRYQGQFENSHRIGEWLFYYKNGNLEKTVLYENDSPLVRNYFKKNGKCVFKNGNGIYKGRVISGFKQTVSYYIKGNIKDGKLDGKWEWHFGRANAVEYFKDGYFIEGKSYGLVYSDIPKITLTGFCLHEKVDFFKFIAIPTRKYKSILFSELLTYQGKHNLNNNLGVELSNLFIKTVKDNTTNWCLFQFQVSKENTVKNIQIYANNMTIESNMEEFLTNIDGFKASRPENKPSDCIIFGCCMISNGQFHIPQYSFNSSFDLINLIPEK